MKREHVVWLLPVAAPSGASYGAVKALCGWSNSIAVVDSAYIGVDQGTRSSKAAIISASGEELFIARAPVGLNQINAQMVEQDPIELLTSVRTVLDCAMRFAAEQSLAISGIGLAVQRSGVCAWDSETGQVVHPLITWADTRTADRLEAISLHTSMITQRTSLPIVANYAAGKIALLQERFLDPKIFVSTLDTFLLWHLIESRPFLTDDTMAARTMLYSIDRREWDADLCRLLSVQSARLPAIRPVIEVRGTYQGIPLLASLGDQQAALLALKDSSHHVFINFGSIVSILAPFQDDAMERLDGFITSVLFSFESDTRRFYRYLIEGIVNAGAAVIDHLMEKGMIESVEQVEELCHEARARASNTTVFLPLGGTATPDWIEGIPNQVRDWNGTSRADYVCGAIENIGSFVVRQIDILKAANLLPRRPRALASGGLSNIRYLLQFIADCCDMEIDLSESPEATARGAAIAAAHHDGLRFLQSQGSARRRITSNQGSDARERYDRWSFLLERAKNAKGGKAL